MPGNLSTAPACHVVCLLLALLVQLSHQQSCGEQSVCRGDRPRLSTGCCPVEAGQECQPANGKACDTELGFFCLHEEGDVVADGTGVCQGRYNLQASAFGETEVDLSWDGFAPPGYMFEYVILFREEKNHNDITQWTMKEIGDQPSYTLRRLTPATLYFIKVAVWEDAYAGTLGNTTETIIIETRHVEFCEHQGNNYLVGEPFIHECEDNCTCLPTGSFKCEALCPERGVPEVEEGCHVTAGDECCDYRISCPVAGEPCEFEGQVHSHGSEFEVGCRYCVCLHGQVECDYPQDCHEMEPTASCSNPRSRDVEGQCCPEWYCDDTCNYENQTYNHLEYFTSAHCGLCQCDTTDGVQCAPDCPPVVMVLPDAACPDPHVRQDGCCDTLHCHDPSLDIAQFVRRMFALSYSPVSLTLSFEVDPQSEVNGVPLYCQYEILYANTSDPSDTWHRRYIQPVDVRLHHDQSQNNNMEPSEALTHENAIVVGARAYVTLSGMYPNTTYYVKIIPLDGKMQDDPGRHLNYSDTSISAMVVVKTLPLQNATSCFHDGKEVLHGQPVSSPCNETCSCIMGKISCQSSCEAKRVVMAASPSCPQPRLEKLETECCPHWQCYPTATGCRHNGVIMESGQSVTEACQVCTCLNSSVQCNSVCPPSGSPPRQDCQLTNISGHCCPQWECPLETHIPRGVKSSILLHFNGTCQHPSVSNFAEDLQIQVFHYVSRHSGCAKSSGQSALAAFCDKIKVEVICSGSKIPDEFKRPRKRRRRSTSASDEADTQYVPVLVSLHMNFSTSVPDKEIVQTVQSAGLQLLSLLNVSLAVTLKDGQYLTSSANAQQEGLTYVCDEGFSFVENACVLSEIESTLSFKANVHLKAVQVTDSSVGLQWSSLEKQMLTHISGLTVEHRKQGSVQWLSSTRLEPYVTSFILTSLAPDQRYSARLVALTEWSGKEKWNVGSVEFSTARRLTSVSGTLISSLTVTFREVTVSDTSVFLHWDSLPEEDLSQLSAVNVVYKKSHEKHYTKRHEIFPLSQCWAKLQGLEVDTAYTAEIAMLMMSGETATSHPVHFVTQSSRKSSADLLIAVVISCVVTAVAGVIVILTCVLWRRSRRKGGNTGFENKTYGIQLENNNEEIQIVASANPAVN